MTSEVIRVLLVDDHAALRQGLAMIFAQEAGLAVVGQAANGFEAVEAATELVPGVVLMDLHMPGRSGVEACRRIRELVPSARVLILSSSVEDNDRLDAQAAGAVGYLLKCGEVEHLINAVRAAGAGLPVLTETGPAVRVVGHCQR